MKKIIISCVAGIVMSVTAIAADAATKILTNYDQLLQALQQDDNVSAIIHFNHCSATVPAGVKKTDVDPGDTTKRLNFNVFMHYKAILQNQQHYTIATSNTILTEHHIFGSVYEYARLRVFEDNSVELYTAYLDPKTFEVKAKGTLTCQISNGNDQNGVVLFDATL